MRRWRVGSLSMGIILLAFGVLLLVSFFVKVNVINIILMLWPIVLICIGLEIVLQLFLKRDEDIKIKYDVLSILFTSAILIVSTGIYAATSVMGMFDTKQEFYAVCNIKPQTVRVDKTETLAGADGLRVSGGFSKIKVVPTNGSAISVKYSVLAETNDADYAKKACEGMVEFDLSKEVLLLSNADMVGYDRRMSYPIVQCIIYLPEGKTLDLTECGGTSITIDKTITDQVKTK